MQRPAHRGQAHQQGVEGLPHAPLHHPVGVRPAEIDPRLVRMPAQPGDVKIGFVLGGAHRSGFGGVLVPVGVDPLTGCQRRGQHPQGQRSHHERVWGLVHDERVRVPRHGPAISFTAAASASGLGSTQR